MLYSNIIKRAIQESKKSTFSPRMGAVVFKGKRIYGSGHNGVRSSSISLKYKKWEESLHAEQSALLNLDWEKLKGCSILVYRVNSFGKLGMAKPCPMCQKLIKYVGIKNIYYTNEDGEIILEKV
jgi:deoxycytidylate deaminase